MGVNNLGMGILLEAKDLASGVLARFGANLTDTVGKTTTAGKQIQAGLKEAGLGLSLFAAGAAGLAALSPATEAAAKFNNGIAEITTLTSEASLGFDNVSASVLGMNAAFGGGVAGQTKAFYDGVSAGAADASEAVDLLNASNKLAVAGKTEVGVALDGLTSSMNAYGVSFSQAADFSDSFFTAVQKGKTTIPELASNIGKVAPTAASLGISFDELTAAIASISVPFGNTAESVTGLKAALANIIKPSSEATAEASRLGIKFDAAAVRSKGFAGVLKDITSASGYNADTLSKLFTSVEGLNAVNALAANGGMKFAEALAAMANKSGAAERAFETMRQQLDFQQKRMEGLKENSLILIGEALVPMKLALVGIANSVLSAFNAIPTPVRNFLVQAFAIGSALLAAVGAVIALKGAITVGSAALSAMGVSFGGVLAAIGPVVGVLALVAVGFAALKAAYDANIGGFADRVNSAVASVKLALSALGQLFSSGEFSGSVMQDLDKAENSGVKKFAIGVFLIANRIQAFFASIGEGFSGAMDAVTPAIDGVAKSVAPIAEAFSSLFGSSGAGDAAASFDRWAAAGRAVGAVLARIAAAVLNVVSLVGSLVSGAVSGLGKLGPIFAGAGDALGELGSVLSEIGASLGLAGDQGVSVGEIFFAFGRGIAGVFGAALGIISGVVSGIAGLLRGLATMFSGVVDIIGGIADGDWSRVWLGIRKIAFSAVQAIIAVVGGLVQGIAGAVDAIGGVVGKDIGAAKSVAAFRKQLESDARGFFGVPEPGAAAPAGAPVVPSGAGTTGAAVAATDAQRSQFQALAGAVAQGVTQKPPVVNQTNTTIVQIDGEEIPSRSTTRTSTAAGIPTAPAGV